MSFIVFGGPLYERGGGWQDVARGPEKQSPACVFGDLETAKQEAEKHAKRYETETQREYGAWWQVVDLDTLTIVYEQEIKYK